VSDFNTPLSSIDKSSKQNTNKDASELNCTIDQIDLKDIYRISHPTAVEHTFFSAAH
jgi:hypothetical protein